MIIGSCTEVEDMSVCLTSVSISFADSEHMDIVSGAPFTARRRYLGWVLFGREEEAPQTESCIDWSESNGAATSVSRSSSPDWLVESSVSVGGSSCSLDGWETVSISSDISVSSSSCTSIEEAPGLVSCTSSLELHPPESTATSTRSHSAVSLSVTSDSVGDFSLINSDSGDTDSEVSVFPESEFYLLMSDEPGSLISDEEELPLSCSSSETQLPSVATGVDSITLSRELEFLSPSEAETMSLSSISTSCEEVSLCGVEETWPKQPGLLHRELFSCSILKIPPLLSLSLL